MKIEIKDGNESLIITDETLDNDNFVDVIIAGVERTVSLDDLLGAIIAFNHKRSQKLDRELKDN